MEYRGDDTTLAEWITARSSRAISSPARGGFILRTKAAGFARLSPRKNVVDVQVTLAEPLKGITVLDLGQVYNGPYCGFLLAQAGARVIKVEAPNGETLRHRALDTSQRYPFALLNGGKECITVNIKHPEGAGLLRRLASRADVLLENLAPGTMSRHGLGSEVLREDNPRLIYARSTAFGGSGPYSEYLGMDITIQAISGMMSITGEADGPPLKAGAAICDFLAGIHLYGGIVSALYQREKTGLGAMVDISMQDCMFPPMATAIGSYFFTGGQLPRTGNRHPALSAAPYNLYPTKDGDVAIICIREAHWRHLCDAMKQPGLATDPRFATMKDRSRNMDEVDRIVGEWTRRHTKEEVFSLTQAHGVISAPARDLAEVVQDPHMQARSSLFWEDDDVMGRNTHCTTPIRFGDGEPPRSGPVAALGAHTDAVLEEFLGMDPGSIEALRDRGAI